MEGRFAEGKELIVNARKKYPHDYRIMNKYMWDVAGGSAGNDSKTLLKNKDKLTQLCDCILEGCTQDDLRAEAINMKAKLLHAAGDTEAALEILSKTLLEKQGDKYITNFFIDTKIRVCIFRCLCYLSILELSIQHGVFF